MFEGTKEHRIVTLLVWLMFIWTLATVPSACNRPTESFTVGILNSPIGLEACVEGFKAGMSELGYAEGTNIQYIYKGPVETTS